MPWRRNRAGKHGSRKDSPNVKRKEPESLTPHLTQRDPSLSTVLPQTGPIPPPLPSTSKQESAPPVDHTPENPPNRSCWTSLNLFCYNPAEKTYCNRNCVSWCKFICYIIMYLIFLTTYFMMFLYLSLTVIKSGTVNIQPTPQSMRLYSSSIGITATPTSEHSNPFIWFRRGNTEDVKKYTKSIDELLLKHRRDSREDIITRLGPCGKSPYGYTDKPCVLFRINKRYKWAAKPLTENSTNAKEAPAMVQKWMKGDKTKYWLLCDGVHSYDREHLGDIKYYPNPPGFDASEFPLELSARSPLIGVQFSDYTEGVSVEIECKLWYDSGSSAVSFVLYVAPKNSVNLLRMISSRSK